MVLVLLSIASYGLLKLSRPGAEWMEKVPEGLSKIELKVNVLRKPLETLNKAAEELKKISRMGEEKEEARSRNQKTSSRRYDLNRHTGISCEGFRHAHIALFSSRLRRSIS